MKFIAFRLGNHQWAVYNEQSMLNALAIVNYRYEVNEFLEKNFGTYEVDFIE